MADNQKGHTLSPPSRLLALSEFPRAAFEMSLLPAAAPTLLSAQRGDGHPVLVLPGFLAGDRSTLILRRYLKTLGYDAYGWALGQNRGRSSVGDEGELLAARLEEILDATGRSVSLIGWSLGGAMARRLSRRNPKALHQVITLGSPIGGHAGASNASKSYQVVTGEKVSSDRIRKLSTSSKQPPPVPSTAIFSKQDGIVAWQNSLESKTDYTENIQILGSHCGLGHNPAALLAIADRLAQPEGEWSPFDRTAGCNRLLFGAPEYAATH